MKIHNNTLYIVNRIGIGAEFKRFNFSLELMPNVRKLYIDIAWFGIWICY